MISNLQTIPGIGKSIEKDLQALGFTSVHDLKGKDPEKMYLESCRQAGVKIDRCLLYVYRCAVYYASHSKHDARLLKWWNWKD